MIYPIKTREEIDTAALSTRGFFTFRTVMHKLYGTESDAELRKSLYNESCRVSGRLSELEKDGKLYASFKANGKTTIFHTIPNPPK